MDQHMLARRWGLVLAYRASLAALILIAFVTVFRRPAAPPQQAMLKATPPPQAPTRGLVAKSAATTSVGAARAPITTTDHLVLFTSTGSYSGEQVTEIAHELETALLYVQERTAMRLLRPINIMFDRRPEACGLDAVAYTQVRTIVVYVCPETPDRRAVNVLAHELVHQLAHDHYGAAHLQADLILSEGLATWGAGRYWLGDSEDFRTFVAANYSARLLPLGSDPRGDESAATLNQLYYQWASFIEWIVAQHGPEAIEHLYGAASGRRSGSAPYTTVLGLPLTEAEAHWRSWLR